MNHLTGVRIIAAFDSPAVSFVENDPGETLGTRSRNDGVTILPGFEDKAQPLASAAPTDQPAAEIPALVERIESALVTIHAALAEIKRLQAQPTVPQSKAG